MTDDTWHMFRSSHAPVSMYKPPAVAESSCAWSSYISHGDAAFSRVYMWVTRVSPSHSAKNLENLLKAFLNHTSRDQTHFFPSTVLKTELVCVSTPLPPPNILFWLSRGWFELIVWKWPWSAIITREKRNCSKSMPTSKKSGAFPISRPQGSFPAHNDVMEWPKKKCTLRTMLRCGKNSIYPSSSDYLVAQLKKKSPKLLPRPDTIPLLDSMDLNDFRSEDYLASAQRIESKP